MMQSIYTYFYASWQRVMLYVVFFVLVIFIITTLINFIISMIIITFKK
jgi:hypothetical protein